MCSIFNTKKTYTRNNSGVMVKIEFACACGSEAKFNWMVPCWNKYAVFVIQNSEATKSLIYQKLFLTDILPTLLFWNWRHPSSQSDCLLLYIFMTWNCFLLFSIWTKLFAWIRLRISMLKKEEKKQWKKANRTHVEAKFTHET